MRKHVLVLLALLAALVVGVPATIAGQGNQGKSHEHGNKSAHNDNDQGWERHDGYEYRTYSGPDNRPPGWSHGKKTGWGNCGMPPGQAKKYGCRTYVYQGRPNYYYEDGKGNVFVRRPLIDIHGSVNIAP
jgi:hypothetical protein